MDQYRQWNSLNKGSNNGNCNTPPGIPNKRAANKKQNTRGTPEKMKKNQQEDMEIRGGKPAITVLRLMLSYVLIHSKQIYM